MTDDTAPSDPGRLRAGLDPLVELSRGLLEAIKAGGGAGAIAEQGTDVFAALAQQLGSLPRSSVEPLRRVVQEQRRMADLMAAWADQHRILAEQLAESAEQLHRLAEDSAAVIDPVVAYADRLDELANRWMNLPRRG